MNPTSNHLSYLIVWIVLRTFNDTKLYLTATWINSTKVMATLPLKPNQSFKIQTLLVIFHLLEKSA